MAERLFNEIDSVESVNLKDKLEGNIIEFYPYVMLGSMEDDSELEFIRENSSSLIRISNSVFSDNQKFNLHFNEDTQHYSAEMIGSISGGVTLGSSTSTSSISKVLENQQQFSLITNDILSLDSQLVIVWFKDKPYDEDEYKKGNQQAYISSGSKTPSSVSRMELSIDTKKILSQFDLVSVNLLEDSFENSKLLFTTRTGFNENVKNLKDKNGVTVSLEPQALVSRIFAKGLLTEAYTGNLLTNFLTGTDFELNPEFGEAGFITDDPMTPFKIHMNELNERLEIFADWFDYDVVLPYALAEELVNPQPLSKLITNENDRKLVEDMILISAGSAQSWDQAPIINSTGDKGKIDPTYRVGHSAIKISNIIGTEPQITIDGLYRKHLRKFPNFRNDKERIQRVTAFINAFSNYMISNFATAGGENSYHEAILPWYIRPATNTPILFDKTESIPNPDKGSDSTPVTTYLLNDNIKYQIQTNFLKEDFSKRNDFKPTNLIKVPKAVDISSQKTIQTDRKVFLPYFESTISASPKNTLPADTRTNDNSALRYIVYLPIQDQRKMEEFYLNSLTTKSSVAAGSDINIQLDPSPEGVVLTQNQANALVLKGEQATIKVPPIISVEERLLASWTLSLVDDRMDQNFKAYVLKVTVEGKTKDKSFTIFDEKTDSVDLDQMLSTLIRETSGVDTNSKKVRYDTSIKLPASGSHTGKVFIQHSEFSPATITTTSGSTSLSVSFAERQVTFNKVEWRKFLKDFRILNKKRYDYNLNESSNAEISKLTEIVFHAIWTNNIVLKFKNNIEFDIPAPNANDESISVFRIIIV